MIETSNLISEALINYIINSPRYLTEEIFNTIANYINKGADINFRLKKETALSTFIFRKDIDCQNKDIAIEVIKMLISESNIKARDDDDVDVVQSAISQGCPNEIIIFLLEYHNNLGIFLSNYDGENPMHHLVMYGFKEPQLYSLCEKYVRHGTHEGKTPLHLAVRDGLSDIVPYLIDLGADIDARDNEGRTPLQYLHYYTYKDSL